MKKTKRIIWIIGLVLIALAAAFRIYVSIYYHADDTALSALESDATVHVTETDYGWLFDGPSENTALIFYPGAKVETEAYAPFLHLLAEQEMDVCLVDMPFHLAFFDSDAASKVTDDYNYEKWYIGGHSLGGAMAAAYASSHGEELAGVILCAAYPTKPLNPALTEILLYGSEDEVVNMEKIQEGRKYAPDTFVETVIEGGNHAQFGNYGEQKGDGTAGISAGEQQEQAVELIMESLR